MKTIHEKTFDLLESTGLNWTVKKQPLFAVIDEKNIITNSFGIMKGEKHLGTVGTQYEPFQNFQLAETIIQATESLNLQTTRGGSLQDDRKIYLQAEISDEFIGKSAIKRWITALNSHNGSTSIGFGSSNTTVVCQNTFHHAYKDLSKFRHTTSAVERIKQAMQQLRQTLLLDEQLMTGFKKMANLELNDEIVERVLNNIFKLNQFEKQDDISTKKTNQITEFAGSLNQSINEQGKTVWALFNAVTRYTNHISAPQDSNKKINYLMDGQGYNINNSSFEEIMKYVEKNTLEYVPMG